jgi:oxygen-independent coproporphyrinogen-3 oxidase
MGNWLGIGAGAHSHVDGKLWANVDDVEAYMHQAFGEVRNDVRNAIRATPDDSHLASAQRNSLFMGLRLLEGLPIKNFQGFEKEVTELTKEGLLEEKNGKYRLTRRGLFLGNLVFEKFI